MRMFQSVFIRALLFAGFCTQCLADDQRPGKGSAHPAEASYKLIWQDEFDGDKLDRSKWAPEDDTVIGKYGHGNGESQVYVDAEGETFYVKDGELTIVAIHAPGRKYPVKKEPNGPVLKEINKLPFRSAKLQTQGLASFTYGIFEARIRNPVDAATGKKTAIPVWPAFWISIALSPRAQAKEVEVINQKAIGKNACGPCAYVNSLLRSGNKQEPVN